MKHHLYEVELAKAEIERTEPLSVAYFFFQLVKLLVFNVYYTFPASFVTQTFVEDSEMGMNSL